MPCSWSFACSHVVLDEHSLDIIPRSDGIRSQTCEPVHYGGFEHDRQIICHYVGASSGRTHNNGITGKPLLGVGLAIIGFNPGNLKVYRPLDGL